jgi:hypothetical protein
MHLSGLDRFMWAATFFGHILILVVLFARRRAPSFPAFTIYIAENIAKTIVLYFVLNYLPFTAYVRIYRSWGIAGEIIQLFVFYELATHVFCPTRVWARDVQKAFLGMVGTGALVALLLTCLAQPTAHSLIQTFILRSNFFSAALMSELFVSMMVLSSRAGLPWKTHVAKIAQGLGAYSLVSVAKDIVLNYVSLQQHVRLDTALSHLIILTYLACEIFWVVTLWQDAPAPRELPESMREQIYSLQRLVDYDLTRVRSWRGN